jgi:uncharacterized protein DUF5329
VITHRPRIRRAAVALALLLPALTAVALPTRPAVEQARIEYLIGEVKNSPAIFIRNGREYGAERAAAHLERKLRFAGRRVQTVRQFIVGIASRSEESGRPYELRWPDGRRQPLSEWLLEKLEHYEKERHPATPATASPPH